MFPTSQRNLDLLAGAPGGGALRRGGYSLPFRFNELARFGRATVTMMSAGFSREDRLAQCLHAGKELPPEVAMWSLGNEFHVLSG